MRLKLLCFALAAAFAPAGIARQNVAVINTKEAILDTADGRAARVRLEDQYRDAILRLGEAETAEARREREDLQSQIQAQQTRVIQDLGKKMSSVLEKYAQRKHYEAVLDVSDPNTPVMWFKKANDITKEIVAEYDRTYSGRTGTHSPAGK